MKFPIVTPTPHNAAKKGEIADMVLIFGDPTRCKRAAEHYLENCKEVSSVRGNYYFTGEWKGKKVTFGTSGMGKGSMGIYAYELFAFYDVKTMIRIGTSGAYSDLVIGDNVLVGEAVDDSPYFCRAMCGEELTTLSPTPDLRKELIKSSEELGIKLQECRVHSTDIFYFARSIPEMALRTDTKCAEMESLALFAVARRLGKRAASLLAITDTLYVLSRSTEQQRAVACNPIIEVALNLL